MASSAEETAASLRGVVYWDSFPFSIGPKDRNGRATGLIGGHSVFGFSLLVQSMSQCNQTQVNVRKDSVVSGPLRKFDH